MKAYKHISKLVPESAPRWIEEAAERCSAVWCTVSRDGRQYAWILPIYSCGVTHPYRGSDGNWYMWAEPVTGQKELDDTEGMR